MSGGFQRKIAGIELKVDAELLDIVSDEKS